MTVHPGAPLRPLSRIIIRLPALALAAALGLAGVRPAAAQDGRAILMKTLRTYHAFTTYSGEANVDTVMLDSSGKAIKQIGSSAVMKLQKPNLVYIFFQTPVGSRSIYCDGKTFSVYDATPNQFITSPAPTDLPGLLRTLLVKADVAAQLDPLYFLTQNTLPKDLVNLRVKSSTTYNGHPVYVVTGVTNPVPVVIRKGNTTTTTPTAYWSWWIDRTSSLIYKVETRTPNVIKPVSFGDGAQRFIREMKGTLLMRHTVTVLKPEANLRHDEFVFVQPRLATRKQTIADVLGGKGK